MSEDIAWEKLQPLRKLLRTHRKQNLKRPQVDLAHSLGMGDTWITDLEIGRRGMGVGTMIRWVEAVEAQEFGLYIVLNGVYTDIPLIDPEDM